MTAAPSTPPAPTLASLRPLRWPAEDLWQAIEPLLPGFSVEVLPELDSTNSELMRRARAGHTAPVLLVAEAQRAGRGRLGRGWHSAPGASLTFSLGLPLAPADWSGLSLAVGVALAESLHESVTLKWPNDLWWQGRKLGGILVETAALPEGALPAGAAGLGRPARYVVIGVGLNVAPLPVPPATPATGLPPVPPAWLQALLPGVDAPAALARVAVPLARAVLAFGHAGFAPFQPGFAARDALAGQAVRLSDGAQGQAEGVDASGALRVRTAAGVQAVSSAEVSVRPAAPFPPFLPQGD
ncbi:biotin--[acetyl-CoA-carboxylase] ligase [Comamonadaceae bacterium OH2545_COT-014]|nr:biotin--[acetyl-CoA-carboxylase] ligase [Comamonadaceae bacterium OH2545_COT-014]